MTRYRNIGFKMKILAIKLRNISHRDWQNINIPILGQYFIPLLPIFFQDIGNIGQRRSIHYWTSNVLILITKVFQR